MELPTRAISPTPADNLKSLKGLPKLFLAFLPKTKAYEKRDEIIFQCT